MSQSLFVGAGQESGIEMWRVEQQLLVKQATINGKLCTDEVYVVLVTVSDKNSNDLNHHLHVWCGVDASLNEISIAERKSIELGGLFDSGCIPVREDQGVESKLFLSSFKSLGGIKFVSRTKIPNVSERKAKQLSSLSGKNVVGIRLGSDIKQSTADDLNSQLPQRISILKRLIKESILAFPSDAHLRVLEFFENGLEGGIDADRALLLRQCWSKVLLGTQAFGRKSQSGGSITNPDLFAEELIRELSYGDRDVSRLIALSTHYATPNSSEEKNAVDDPRDILKNLQQFNAIDRQLAATTAGIFSPQELTISTSTDDERNLHTQTSITMFRSSLKGTKLTFKANKSNLSAYCPLDRRLFGQPDILSGTLALPKSTNHDPHAPHRELPLYLSTTELMGVRMTCLQPSVQDLAWSTFQTLHELLVSGVLNIFPLPIGAQRDATLPGATVFAFESLSARPLFPLFGPVLSTYLRKHPSVALLWCGQLVAAYRALRDECSGRLVKAVGFDNVFVRENGMLLLGGAAFSPSDPEVGAEDHFETEAFLRMAVHLLSCALCLSRCEEVVLCNTADMFSDNSFHDQPSEMYELTVAVVAGSSLELVVRGHHCNSVVFTHQSEQPAEQPTRRGGSSAPADAQMDLVDASELRVQLEDGTGNAVISGSPNNLSSSLAATQKRCLLSNGSIFVHTASPGVVTLTVSALVDPSGHNDQDDDEEHMFSAGPALADRGRSQQSRTAECTVRVVVIPRYAVPSVALLELIGYIEEFQEADRSRAANQPGAVDLGPEMVLNAQCCGKASLKKLSEALSAENSERQQKDPTAAKESSLQREWTEIGRAIERLGVKSYEI